MTEVINIMRHESVFNPAEHNYPMHIIGAGATGSRAFEALVELGMKRINVYDHDVVESHNLANQIYTHADIGQPKVQGCANFLRRKLGIPETDSLPIDCHFRHMRVDNRYLTNRDHMTGGVVFIFTDTMKSRRMIFDFLAKRCDEASENISSTSAQIAPMLIIETRMGSTHGSVFTINPFDNNARKQWLSTLVDDENTDNIELSPCGTPLSVGATASLIANYAVWQMIQFFVDPVGMQPRIDLFFKPTLTVTSSAIAA